MRNKFDEQLVILNQDLIKMGALCEESIELVYKAMIENNSSLTDKITSMGGEIDKMERTIESMCLKLLLHQQPVAGDLRQISAALKMITDMERIGDQAEDIAEIITFLNGHSAEECEEICEMAKEAMKMVTESVNAYVRRDMSLAEEVIKQDDIVDDYFDKVKNRLIEIISKDKNCGQYALDLLMIAKYFERIGDHATNIAEWVLFSITGSHEKITTNL